MMTHTVEDGVSEALASMAEDVSSAVSRNVSGAHLLHELLSAPWLHALLQIYECLLEFRRLSPHPFLPHASGLAHEVQSVLQMVHISSAEASELHGLLSCPHVKALLSCHDAVARADFEPVLPALPDGLPEDEEAMRIVCLVKNKQPLGATIRKDEGTGEIFIARVIRGGLADRSGLLHPGDLLLEVNGKPLSGLQPEQVIHILMKSQGTILFKVVPNASQLSSGTKPVFMRAMVDYCPLQDSSIPCPDAGVAFSKGDLLEVVDRSDGQWWQARRLPSSASCTGLIPSAAMLKGEVELPHMLRGHGATCCQPFDRISKTSLLFQRMNFKTSTPQMRKKHILVDEAEWDIPDGVYLGGFRRSFRLWRKMHSKRRRQSCASCSINRIALATPYEEVVLYRRPLQENQRLVILVGASGVGVNELRQRLVKLNPSTFQGPLPHTSRPIRAWEQTGREYHFVTKELFDYMVCNHRFVEYGEYKGHMYGTSVDAIDDVIKRGRVCIIDIEPHNVPPLRSKKLKPYVIFVKPPSMERLRQTRRNARIISSFKANRAFTKEDFVEMEEVSRQMEAKYKHLFDHMLVNDELMDTCLKLCSVIQQAQEEPQWIPVSWTQAED
ncbi:MAGUK p55 subfamily member 4-like [Dunckerocampus dactyliophorus]|uniref:MAGUK p55 subfamily member 4-like n=1 Tax=Dunckerocampus dactyliophorus TaxID=161453 RepID=UPI0024053546|nr:MAGUK p55 subfamily member 4-like [Dunckerocampus dactyliophorus]